MEGDIKATEKLLDKEKRSYLCHREEAKKSKRSLRKKKERKKDNFIIEHRLRHRLWRKRVQVWLVAYVG
jgi:hypothetical protein